MHTRVVTRPQLKNTHRSAYQIKRNGALPPKLLIWVLMLCITFTQLFGLNGSKLVGLYSTSEIAAPRLNSPSNPEKKLIQLLLADVCSSQHTQQLFLVNAQEHNDFSNDPAKPLESDHQHCAACLVGLDNSVPIKSQLWRDYAAALAFSRPLPLPALNLSQPFLKPFAQGPPTLV